MLEVDLRHTRVVTGAAAGNITVTGIKKGDRIVLVQDLTTGPNLAGEFTATADDTINNTGGTSTATHAVMVEWIPLRHMFESGTQPGLSSPDLGRSSY